MIFVLDTTIPDVFRMGLCTDRGVVRTEQVIHAGRRRLDGPARVLAFLRKHDPHSRITGIVVRDAAGTFSGVRLGIAIVNTLVLSREIRAVNVQCGEGNVSLSEIVRNGTYKLSRMRRGQYLVPRYHKPPNITAPVHRRQQRTHR